MGHSSPHLGWIALLLAQYVFLPQWDTSAQRCCSFNLKIRHWHQLHNPAEVRVVDPSKMPGLMWMYWLHRHWTGSMRSRVRSKTAPWIVLGMEIKSYCRRCGTDAKVFQNPFPVGRHTKSTLHVSGIEAILAWMAIACSECFRKPCSLLSKYVGWKGLCPPPQGNFTQVKGEEWPSSTF